MASNEEKKKESINRIKEQKRKKELVEEKNIKKESISGESEENYERLYALVASNAKQMEINPYKSYNPCRKRLKDDNSEASDLKQNKKDDNNKKENNSEEKKYVEEEEKENRGYFAEGRTLDFLSAINTIESITYNLSNKYINIGLLGSVGSGKSTLLNGLLSQRYAAVGNVKRVIEEENNARDNEQFRIKTFQELNKPLTKGINYYLECSDTIDISDNYLASTVREYYSESKKQQNIKPNQPPQESIYPIYNNNIINFLQDCPCLINIIDTPGLTFTSKETVSKHNSVQKQSNKINKSQKKQQNPKEYLAANADFWCSKAYLLDIILFMIDIHEFRIVELDTIKKFLQVLTKEQHLFIIFNKYDCEYDEETSVVFENIKLLMQDMYSESEAVCQIEYIKLSAQRIWIYRNIIATKSTAYLKKSEIQIMAKDQYTGKQLRTFSQIELEQLLLDNHGVMDSKHAELEMVGFINFKKKLQKILLDKESCQKLYDSKIKRMINFINEELLSRFQQKTYAHSNSYSGAIIPYILKYEQILKNIDEAKIKKILSRHCEYFFPFSNNRDGIQGQVEQGISL